MKCPDCGHDFPAKPEVVIQKEPCKCGMTSEFRQLRVGAVTILCIVLSAFASCFGSEYWTTRQVEMMKDHYEIRDKRKADIPEAQKLGPPFDVVPKEK
jgi:hypothetical protein